MQKNRNNKRAILSVFKVLFLQLSLLILGYATAWANSVEEHWIQKVPEVLRSIDLETMNQMSIFTDGDYATYLIDQVSSSSTMIHCHYHIDDNSSHCDREIVGNNVPEHYEMVFSLSQDELEDFFELTGQTYVSQADPVWPWVVGAVATYYFVKKIINFWVYKTFKPQPHSHENFFIGQENLNQHVESQLNLTEDKLNRLNDIFLPMSIDPMKNVRRHDLQLLIEERIFSLTKKTVSDLLDSYCETCGTHHFSTVGHANSSSENLNFVKGMSKHQSAMVLPLEMQASNSSAIKGLPSFESQHPEDLSRLGSESELDPKKMIERGVIIRSTQLVLQDMKRELLAPIVSLLKASGRLLRDRQNIKQLDAYVRTNFKVALGESNLATASGILLSLATIKVLGETIESAFVGPYHIFCQISDAAVVAAGLGLFSSYHCLRQPLRQKDLSLVFKRKFWTFTVEKLKNPLKNKSAINDFKNESPEKLLLAEIYNLKSEIKKLIWKLRLKGQISSSSSNEISYELGQISKALEDMYFDYRMDSSQESLLELLNRIKPIMKSYNELYQRIVTVSVKSMSLNDNVVSSCAGYLNP